MSFPELSCTTCAALVAQLELRGQDPGQRVSQPSHRSVFKQPKPDVWTAHGQQEGNGFYPVLICKPQYFPAEVQTICHEFKATDNRVDFLSSLSPTDNPQIPSGPADNRLQTVGVDRWASSPSHSLEKCLLVFYLNKLNIPTPNNARASNGHGDQFRIWVSYLLILSIPTPLLWHPLLRFFI